MINSELSSFGDWELKKKLGAGGFGEVLHWAHRHTGQEIATKRCVLDRDSMHDDEVYKLKERWLREYKWMHSVATEFIVRGIQLSDEAFIAYLNTQHGVWRSLPVIVMEYCNGGDLRQELKKVSNSNGLSEHEVRQVMHALGHAIQYLHNKCKIEHRDLKPDNIVVHIKGKQKIYKLTDFGFGCNVLDNTTKASIVGTINYIAPEIVNTSQYTKTVDYWSMGVIAFELMCGVLPFIPHQTLLSKIKSLQEKPQDCIAITEDVAASNQKFVFQCHLFPENRMTSVFQSKMEYWLRLALDFNFRTRGCLHTPNKDLVIFTELDNILKTKVLTIFCLNTYQFYSYDVSIMTSMHDLTARLEQETQLAVVTYFFILPTGHPHGKLTNQSQPADLYVAEWADTTTVGGHPAMVYLLSYQGDYSAPSPRVSPLIQHSLQLKSAKELPTWAQEQLIVQTHFLLANEQRHLEALLDGLREYALTLEHEVFLSEAFVAQMAEQILTVGGSLRQFNTMVQQAKIACQKKLTDAIAFFNIWDEKVNAWNAKMEKLHTEVRQSVRRRYSSAYRRIKERASSDYYKEIINADCYQLTSLRRNIKDIHFYDPLRLCRDAVYACMEQRNKFLTSLRLKDVQVDIAAIHQEFRLILEIISGAQSYVQNLDTALVQASAEFQEEMLNYFAAQANHRRDLKLSQQLSALNVDDNKNYLNGCKDAISLDDILQLPSTSQLVEDTQMQINLWESMYDDEYNSLPATIPME